METYSLDTSRELLNKRDAKTMPHLKEYAPVWLVDEKINQLSEMVRFNVIFHHPIYGWVNRSYRYDGFSNILYYLGQVHVSADVVHSLPEHMAYLVPEDATQPSIAIPRTPASEVLAGAEQQTH